LIALKKKQAMERRLARLKELEEEQLRKATAASLEESERKLNEPATVSSDPSPSDIVVSLFR